MSLERLREFIAKEYRSFVSEAVRPVREPGQKPDEGRLIEAATRGAEARQMLESPLMLEFLSKQEAQLVDAMTKCPIADDAGRRNLAIAIQTQRQWWRFLAAAAQDGRAAEQELQRLHSGARPFF